MKYIFLIFYSFTFTLVTKSQNVDFSYYKGGEKSLKEDVGYFLSSQIKFNDTVSFFFVEVRFKKNIDSILFACYGSVNTTNFVEQLHSFFSNKNTKWQRNNMNDSTNIIIPIIAVPYCKLDNTPIVDFRSLSTAKMPKSQNALFFEPIVVELMCVESCRNEF